MYTIASLVDTDDRGDARSPSVLSDARNAMSLATGIQTRSNQGKKGTELREAIGAFLHPKREAISPLANQSAGIGN